MKGGTLKRFFVTAILAALGSVVVGFIFFHARLFDIGRGGYQFLSFGIIGGAVFAAFRFFDKRNAVLILLILVVLNEVLLNATGRAVLWQDLLYYAGLCAAVILFSEYYFRKLAEAALVRLPVLTSLLALNYLVVAVIIYLFYQSNPSVPQLNLSQIIYYDLAQGFLIGLGLGLGIEVAEYILKKPAAAHD